MNESYSLFARTLLAMTMITSPLLADSNNAEEEHVQVGCDILTECERREILEKKIRLYQKIECGESLEEEEIILSAEEREEIEEAISKGTDLFEEEARTVFYHSTYSRAKHHPAIVSFIGDFVQFEDGSKWGVYSGDRHKVLNWMSGDDIVVVPNSWWSSYHYKLVNLNTGVDVRVNLLLGPIYNGIFTQWISEIDSSRVITLEDRSTWKVFWFDKFTVKDWEANHTIIVGFNNGFFSSSYPHILINVNRGEYVAVTGQHTQDVP